MTMYKLKRLTKLFGLTPSNKYRGIDRKSIPDGAEIEDEMDSKIPESKLPIRWKNVDYYKVDDNDVTRKFKEHLDTLSNNSNKSLFTRSLRKRITQLLKDLKGKNTKNIQYVSKDNPDTKGLINIDNTHCLEDFEDKDTIVYSKDINSEFRLVYEAKRPHKENGKNVSKVTIDDCDDHIYNNKVYNKGSSSSYDNPNRFK